jgi:hypothetical protein
MTPNTYSIVNELLRGSVTKEQAIAWIEEGRQHAFKNGRAAERIENGEYAVSMEQAFASLATSHELGRKWEAEETIRYAATLMHPKPLVVNGKAVETKMEKPVPQSVDTRPGPTYCDKCDGTGWTEGGSDMEIGAQCRHCHGSGIAPYQGNVDFTKPPRLRADLASEAVMAETDEEVRARAASEGRDLHAQAERFRETIRGHAIGTTRRHELTAAVINAHPLTIGAPMTDEQIRAWAFRDECLIDLCEKLEERCEELAAENRSLSQGRCRRLPDLGEKLPEPGQLRPGCSRSSVPPSAFWRPSRSIPRRRSLAPFASLRPPFGAGNRGARENRGSSPNPPYDVAAKLDGSPLRCSTCRSAEDGDKACGPLLKASQLLHDVRKPDATSRAVCVRRKECARERSPCTGNPVRGA